ncbi:MAG: winged helix-turn-helix domain-containing protein [Myxococcota bacterium]
MVPVDVGAIDLKAGVVWRDGRRHSLTGLQRGLLQALIETDGPVSTASLLRDVWGYHPRVQSRAVASTVVGVRRLVERDARQPQHVLTVRGEGYRFVAARHAPAWVALSASAEHPTLPCPVRDQLALYAAEALALDAPAAALERLIALGDRPQVQARAQALRLGIRPWLGDLDGAVAEAEAMRHVTEGSEHSLALLLLRLGKADEARARFIALAAATDQVRLYALAQLHAAASKLDHPEARQRFDEAILGAEEAGDRRVLSWALSFRGEWLADGDHLACAQDDADASERWARESLAEHELATALALQLRLARRRGERDRAFTIWTELRGLRQRPGFATAHAGIVRGLRLEGQREVAQRWLRRGRVLARKSGDTWAASRLRAVRDDPA